MAPRCCRWRDVPGSRQPFNRSQDVHGPPARWCIPVQTKVPRSRLSGRTRRCRPARQRSSLFLQTHHHTVNISSGHRETELSKPHARLALDNRIISGLEASVRLPLDLGFRGHALPTHVHGSVQHGAHLVSVVCELSLHGACPTRLAHTSVICIHPSHVAYSGVINYRTLVATNCGATRKRSVPTYNSGWVRSVGPVACPPHVPTFICSGDQEKEP
mmetsp:Transcript_35470/g.92728  ORF Transcript_35470/g.92728 Transcript_35470/m.92728 type:complete len:216 (-) Transcript_35470:36-683(-)